MLKNYIKIAWKVLQRRKFFTFISLFGISFTLMVLMVLTSFTDHLISPNYPEVNRDRTLYMSFVELKQTEKNNNNTSSMGIHLLNNYISKMKTPQKIAFGTLIPHSVDAFSGDKKLKINIKYTNQTFWEVNEFEFLEGKSFNQEQLDNGDFVAVIDEESKKGYFGDQSNVVGEFIDVGNEKYRIIGVVKGVPMTRIFTFGNLYVPYTVSSSFLKSTSFVGEFGAMLLAEDESDFPAIKAELNKMISNIELPNPEDWNLLLVHADTYLESATRIFEFEESSINPFYLILGVFSFLFMLLPALNLVNINISRIMERSSEIGVRKAFGASSSSLVVQFIVENLVITIIGGILGIILTTFALYWLNSSNFIPHLDLKINLKVLLASIVACLFFGLLSGVLPAFKMSKMNVVDALRQGKGK